MSKASWQAVTPDDDLLKWVEKTLESQKIQNKVMNGEVEVSLPYSEPSDIENLTYLFEKYKSTVERGKPNLRAANLLKTYIDVIQVKEAINEQPR